MHEVVYERLVDDFEDEARRLLAACGLDWEPACLQFHQTSRPVRTASVTQVRQPLYRKAVARWKHYEAALADLLRPLAWRPRGYGLRRVMPGERLAAETTVAAATAPRVATKRRASSRVRQVTERGFVV